MAERYQLSINFDNDPYKARGLATITIPSEAIEKIYNHTLQIHQDTQTIGFHKQHAPIAYLHKYYKEHITNHLKEFLLKFNVISYLYEQLREKKIVTIGEPRLEDISIKPQTDAHYIFSFTPGPVMQVRDWRYLPFKTPLRKKYKDIDKQATTFITEEKTQKTNYTQKEIAPGDWIFFDITLLDHKKKPLIKNFKESLWLQIGDEETSEPFRNLFIGRNCGDSFTTNSICLHEYFGSQLDQIYFFQILIKEVLPHAYFCLALFKDQFKLKSERKLHQKIVEVYSFRNDLSLRRSLVEEALALLLRTYPLEIPGSAILRQEKILFDELQINPDYSVYKLQRDFGQKIHSLAQKQIQEHLITDYFALQENTSITDADVYHYLNLTKRPRTKEFIYFLHPSIRANAEELPISHESLKYICIREKTINHVLYHLTK